MNRFTSRSKAWLFLVTLALWISTVTAWSYAVGIV